MKKIDYDQIEKDLESRYRPTTIDSNRESIGYTKNELMESSSGSSDEESSESPVAATQKMSNIKELQPQDYK